MFTRIKVTGWNFDAKLISYRELVDKHGIPPVRFAFDTTGNYMIELTPESMKQGYAYPVFQFNQTEKKHWRLHDVAADINRILLKDQKQSQQSALEACRWWLTPHPELGNKTPASFIGTSRERTLVPLAKKDTK